MDLALNTWGPRELSEEELRQRELEWLLAFDEPPFGAFDTPHSSEAGDYEPPPPKPKPWWIDDPYEDVRSSCDNRLCDVCKHIDFAYLLRKKVEYITEESVSLSPLADIVRKREHCPFCRLVVRSICIAYGDSDADSVPPTVIDGMSVDCSLDNKPVHPQWDNVFQLHINLMPQPENRGERGPKVVIQEFTASGNGSEEPRTSSQLWRGRLVCRDKFNLDLVKRWLDQCGTQHDVLEPLSASPHRNEKRRLPPSFRVIDVQRWCIVRPDENCRYLALSYVWGYQKLFQCTKANISALEKESGLACVREHIPQTIVDAMGLVAGIGEQFLWVDSLCIIQDDGENKHEQISAMDVIYSASILTIIAASGAGANDGLPGLAPGSRAAIQHIEEVQDGLKLTNRLPTVPEGVDQAVWNTRGWTFQERVLSERLLFVTDKQTIFKCRHGSNFEDVVSEVAPIGKPHLEASLVTWDQDYDPDQLELNSQINFFTYMKSVDAYTPRKLSYNTDILNAFAGIIAELRLAFKSGFLYGLPEADLDAALLWQPHGLIWRRVDHTTNIPLFPSWSWAGWEGPVGYGGAGAARSASRVKWVDAYTVMTEPVFFTSDEYRSPIIKEPNSEYWDTNVSPQKTAYYFTAKEPNLWLLHPTAPQGKRRPWKYLQPGSTQLRFCTLVTSFSVTGEHTLMSRLSSVPYCDNNRHTVCPLSMLSCDGYVAGTVHVPATLVASLKWGKHDFILLSRTSMGGDAFDKDSPYPPSFEHDALNIPPRGTAHFPKQVCVDESPFGFDLRRYDKHKPWCIYNVMMVEWKGEVASRVGLGTVHIDAFYQAQPEERLLTLE